VKYMLDTNIVIYFIKHKPPSVAHRINALGDEANLCMSFFTYAELLKGAERSSRRTLVLKQLDALTALVPVLYDTGRSICEHYAQQFLALKANGALVGANDLWIACHALSHQATLVSHNLREFERIQGLRIEDWAS
jgi:tRNA(fMet)-specific endonuclease VapC